MSTFSYRDAVTLMGASEHKAVKALDKLLSGGLLVGSALDALGLLGWFDAKADFIRLSHEYAVKWSEKRSGISRYDRTQRLHAAHTMVVLASFFEALDESGVPVSASGLGLKRDGVLPKVPAELAGLVSTPVPLVTPDRPYEDNLGALSVYYTGLADGLRSFLSGLAVWDGMDDRERGLLHNLAPVACRRYEENIRRLAVDCPEFAFWSSLQDHQATRVVVRTALAEVERLFATLTVGSPSAQRRTELAARYRSVLDHGIIEPDQVPDGLSIPLFRDCYIDPRFQVGRPSSPAQTQQWKRVTVRDDVHDFFIGYLTSPRATQSPLLVLGDPGSGKSVLTKVLAARLPTTDFLPLRVELRTAPTEAELLQQIEHGLRVALQENVSWAEFARSADGALPVVFLDGFDELLQATGLSQTGYLRKVEQFQRDNAALLRPVAVIVTSRISVADRAAIPNDTTIMRLAPFDHNQTGRWISAWNTTNARYFSSKLRPLAVDTVLRYPDLAEQPLLLLMLALYDADGNALQRNKDLISQAELYERLLIRFAHREIVKDEKERTDAQVADEIETELERLSVVALAMFNRGTQWIREHELDRDLTALLGYQPERDGNRTPLSAGEAVLGRFFFIQCAQAVRDQKTLRTYEFLHATFSEYLVARLAWHTLRDLLATEKSTPRLARGRALDDSTLYSLLSFAPLSSRQPVIRFLAEFAESDSEVRQDLTGLLIRVFQNANRYRIKPDYEPTELTMPTRCAVYSANIVLLTIITHGELLASTLFGPDVSVPEAWNRNALFWKSQIHGVAWQELVSTIHLTRVRQDDARDLILQAGGGSNDEDLSSIIGWQYDIPPQEENEVYGFFEPDDAHFLCDNTMNLNKFSLAPTASYEQGLALIVHLNGTYSTFAHAALNILLNDEIGSPRTHTWRALEKINEAFQEDSSPISRLLRSASDVDDVLPRLVSTPQSTAMAELAFDRLGRGIDVASVVASGFLNSPEARTREVAIAAIDASLRLYERGDTMDFLDIRSELSTVDLQELAATRPDLVKRARYAAQEQGWFDEVDWP